MCFCVLYSSPVALETDADKAIAAGERPATAISRPATAISNVAGQDESFGDKTSTYDSGEAVEVTADRVWESYVICLL